MLVHRSLFSGIVATLSLVALTTAAHADEIYSTFGPGDTYNTNVGHTISGASSILGMTLRGAGSFTAAQNFALTSIDLAAWHVIGSNSYNYSIVLDNGGLPTGTSIFSGNTSLASNPSIQSLGASGSLLAGNTYWLVLETTGDDWGAWNYSTSGATGIASDSGGGWNANPSGAAPAFRINGRPQITTALTPEMPAGVQAIPVLLAVGGMALYQRRKKNA